jgi:hypothetical protein
MVKYIAHRQNNLKKLKDDKDVPFFGVELDLRSSSKNIVLNHDPFKKSFDFFKNYKKFKNYFLLIDIKSSGICFKIYNFLKRKKINFLILNLSQPELIQMIEKGYGNNLFLRFSVYEKLNFNKKLNKINWIWVDFFENYFIKFSEYKYLKKFKKKICLTSPDLVGRKEDSIKKYIQHLNKYKIKADMVCVKKKYLEVWKKYYKF